MHFLVTWERQEFPQALAIELGNEPDFASLKITMCLVARDLINENKVVAVS
jgi:hypothetical protein